MTLRQKGPHRRQRMKDIEVEVVIPTMLGGV